MTEDVQMIRKTDLENHNKDGGLWVVIHGKVYDVQEFRLSAKCGKSNLEEYAGRFFYKKKPTNELFQVDIHFLDRGKYEDWLM
jgi:hypothetical protein